MVRKQVCNEHMVYLLLGCKPTPTKECANFSVDDLVRLQADVDNTRQDYRRP